MGYDNDAELKLSVDEFGKTIAAFADVVVQATTADNSTSIRSTNRFLILRRLLADHTWSSVMEITIVLDM